MKHGVTKESNPLVAAGISAPGLAQQLSSAGLQGKDAAWAQDKINR